MEFQFHPASPRGQVRSLVLKSRGEKAVILVTAAAALALASLWVTVPIAAVRSLRRDRSASLAQDVEEARRDRRDLERRAQGLRDRTREASDLLSRIAFLYRVEPKQWPRTLSPEAGALSPDGLDRLASGLERSLESLERGRAILEARESADPGLPGRTPARLPLAGEAVEPAALFGPRISPWTGSEEFFTGLDLAAPAGTAVVAPAAGTVVFTGKVAPSLRSPYSRFGNLVVISHGVAGATLFGHLGKIEVGQGARVRAGQRLGTVGSSGWAASPVLHYEYWRGRGDALAPTDPRFAVLDRRMGPPGVSLEAMEATSAPGLKERPPGL
jgi:murein DD-endopeptidase MepM/ murein hydrolase activator NlpD